MESKAQLRGRLVREGRFEAFQARYEAIKQTGVAAREARQQAAREFPPLGAAEVQAAENDQAKRQKMIAGLAAVLRSTTDEPLDERQVARWVFENAVVPIETLTPADIPGPGALGLLCWVQASPTNYTTFVNSIWSKLLPSKATLEHMSRFDDDGREQFDLLDAFERTLEAGSEVAA